MEVLITGGAGLLGGALIQSAPPSFHLTATQRRTPVNGVPAVTVELAEARAVQALFERVRPALVIHTAYAMQSEADCVGATKNVAEACQATGAALIHMSSDALFDGLRAPYAESDSPAPITEYGRWKAQAEELVERLVPDAAIVRTSLITQFQPLDPRSAWVANALRAGTPITLFVDELRCAVRVDDLAAQLWEAAQLEHTQRQGVWHLAGAEAVSRYTLGLLIAAREGLNPRGIHAALTDPAKRPRDLRLMTARADSALPTKARAISTLLLDRIESAP